jgi:Cysteine rich repeat
MRQLILAATVSLLATSASLAEDSKGTPDEQQACSRDAQRLCRKQLGDDNAVQQCLQENRAKLSKSCQKVFESLGM